MIEEDFVIDGIPFFSQVIEASPDNGLAEAEAAHWSRRACGIACVRMLLDASCSTLSQRFSKTKWELLQEGLSEKAYCDKGWIHAGLLRLLGNYNVTGQCFRGVRAEKIGDIIKSGNVCIVSVSDAFRGGEKEENGEVIGKGGHLILFHGVKMIENTVVSFRCHHPSSLSAWNWENKWVPFEKVENSFSGNLIEVNWSCSQPSTVLQKNDRERTRSAFSSGP